MSTINTLFNFLVVHLLYTGYQISRIPSSNIQQVIFNSSLIGLFTFLLSRRFQVLQHIQEVRGYMNK